jgi:hypothetical protein
VFLNTDFLLFLMYKYKYIINRHLPMGVNLIQERKNKNVKKNPKIFKNTYE